MPQPFDRDNTLTVDEAADILAVRAAYVRRLLDEGAIPSVVDGDDRIRLDDFLAYKRVRDAECAHALDELVRVTEEYGLYDAPMTAYERWMIDAAHESGDDAELDVVLGAIARSRA